MPAALTGVFAYINPKITGKTHNIDLNQSELIVAYFTFR
jgi:hypothetical protein